MTCGAKVDVASARACWWALARLCAPPPHAHPARAQTSASADPSHDHSLETRASRPPSQSALFGREMRRYVCGRQSYPSPDTERAGRRSLERLVAWSEARFGAPVDEAEPGAEEAERVQRILRESAAPDYWFAASRDGNREAHYRGAHLALLWPACLCTGVSMGKKIGCPCACSVGVVVHAPVVQH